MIFHLDHISQGQLLINLRFSKGTKYVRWKFRLIFCNFVSKKSECCSICWYIRLVTLWLTNHSTRESVLTFFFPLKVFSSSAPPSSSFGSLSSSLVRAFHYNKVLHYCRVAQYCSSAPPSSWFGSQMSSLLQGSSTSTEFFTITEVIHEVFTFFGSLMRG